MKSSLVPLVVAVVVSPLTASSRAEACGGLFCSAVQSTPVDQTQERILFEVNDDGTITATVEVLYTGDPRDFSWIVPVPETPTELGVASASALRLLDAATAPTFRAPTPFCSTQQNQVPAPSFGCNAAPDMAAFAPSAPGPGDDGVNVEELPDVGPYEDIVVVDSTDPDALVGWLNDNEYLVTDGMRPIINAYVQEGQKFLALKLRPDVGVGEIVPLRFTCPAEAPHVPIRLTSIAAVPDMSILVFVAGDARYAPANYRDVVIETDDVQWDPFANQFNYYALVSKRVDEEGGQAFVVERAQDAPAIQAGIDGVFLGVDDEQQARDDLAAMLARTPFVTRFYTRMNPEEMTEDPVFVRAGGRSIDGVHDLSSRRIDTCTTAPSRVCGETYCGVGGECGDVDGAPGCLCAQGFVARRITVAGKETVACQDESADYISAALGDADPCAGFSCGDQGRCEAVNGAPTCACAPGFAAVVVGAAPRLECRQPSARFSSDELLWPERLDDPRGDTRFDDEGCAAAGARDPLRALFGLALLFLSVGSFARLLRRSA